MNSKSPLPLPLHTFHLNKSTLIFNRLFTLSHSIALSLLLFYRATTLTLSPSPFLPHLFIFFSELSLSFIWLMSQSFLWRPITRTVFPERLPADNHLPAIDVFVCTADPEKEPPLGVMNTVVSAMALNYPAGRLAVYLSDDGGCPATMEAMREAWRFGKVWVPFCRKYGVKTVSPEAYFAGGEVVVDGGGGEFGDEKVKVKEEYDGFTQRVKRISSSKNCRVNKDHSSIVELIGDEHNQTQIPLLVYVSREKRPSSPHHFKAGALNVLLRVSGVITNSPYILVLDCDMYCNDGDSARDAMCFHLDPKLSPSLAFVQFPQMFHNISKDDIYESELRTTFKTLWKGMDGIKGPCLSGTCYYLKRKSLYGSPSQLEGCNLMKLEQSFASPNVFVKNLLHEMLREAKHVASCTYEKDTNWGKEVGFRYFSVVEDYFTSFNIHCKNWTSVYYMPLRPSFLGAGTTSLNDVLIQGTRWFAGLVEVALSRFSPPIYGVSRMSILQSMCYGWLALFPLYFLPLWTLATVPQLCLLNGTILYPEVKNPFFVVFLYVFVSSNLQHVREILSTGAPLYTWKHEQRIWMMKGVTSNLYGSMHAIMEKLGAKEASFLPTNKVVDDDQVKLYQMGIYDFQTSYMFLVPLCSLIILNFLASIMGIVRISFQNNYETLIQTLLSLFIVVMGYPVIEGMMFRKDKGRIPIGVTYYSIVLSIIVLSFGSIVVMY